MSHTPKARSVSFTGTAIFSTRLSSELPAQIAPRVLTLGFNPQYLGQLIGGLTEHNTAAVMAIPGISPRIIGAAVEGLKTAFIGASKYIWVFGLGESILHVPFPRPRPDNRSSYLLHRRRVVRLYREFIQRVYPADRPSRRGKVRSDCSGKGVCIDLGVWLLASTRWT